MSSLQLLKQSVDAWLIRDDLAASADFPAALLVAESKIARLIRVVPQEASVELVFTGRAADLPANYLAWRQVYVGAGGATAGYLSSEAIRRSAQWQTGRAGAFFTIEGGGGTAGDERHKMLIASPASASAPLTVELLYYARFPALVGDSDTNWLLRNHFDAYLYAVLEAACQLVEAPELESKYAALFDGVAASIGVNQNRARFGTGPKQATNSPRTIV